MTTPINISDEARECAYREHEDETVPPGYHIQLLLNSRDAELQSLRRDKARLDKLESMATIHGEEIMGITVTWADTLRRRLDDELRKDAALSGKENKP